MLDVQPTTVLGRQTWPTSNQGARLFGPHPRDMSGKSPRPADGVNREVDIKAGPVEMVGGRTLDVGDLFDCNLLEPWELFEREQEFLFAK